MIDFIYSEILNNSTVIHAFVYIFRKIVMHKKEIGPPSIAYKHLEMDLRSREDLLQLQMWDMGEKKAHRQHLRS